MGESCGIPALRGGQHCFIHSPARVGERTDARRRGGVHRWVVARVTGKVVPRMVSMDDVTRLIDATLSDERTLSKLSPRTRRALSRDAALARLEAKQKRTARRRGRTRFWSLAALGLTL